MRRLHLLVTNDDGIRSPFLRHLVAALREVADVSVVAPQSEQSWIGKAMTRHRGVDVRRFEGLLCDAWEVDGTPSDCVNIALTHLLSRPPDGVVSGINIGLNAGLPFILGSGTVAGALEGAFHGLPAVALSQDLTAEEFESLRLHSDRLSDAMSETLAQSARRASEIAPELLRGTATGKTLVHNINFPYPHGPAAPLRRTVPSKVLIGPLFAPDQSDSYIFRFSLGKTEHSKHLTDRACLAAGEISHSILDYERLGHDIGMTHD